MIRVYIEDISTIDSEAKYNAYFEELPKYRQDKVNKYKNEKDKYLSILAGKLLFEGLKSLKLDKYINKIIEDENGKPYIPENPIYFSISHRGTKAMVVISNTLVGCDIQFMKEDAISLADRYFTKEEIDEINASDDKVSTFYKLWTLKECYMKASGKGLALGLKNIDTDNENFKQKSYVVDKDYMVSYVVLNDDIDEEKEKLLFR